MELGYHVLLEKPIAKTLKEALELRDMARALKRRVAVCHVLRYTQFYRTLKKIIDSGEIGDVITFNANGRRGGVALRPLLRARTLGQQQDLHSHDRCQMLP